MSLTLKGLVRATVLMGILTIALGIYTNLRPVKNVQLGRQVDHAELPDYNRDQNFDEQKFSFLVQVLDSKTFKGTCSAFVVSDDYAISAAHCFVNEDGALEDVEYKIRTITKVDKEDATEQVLITPAYVVGVALNQDYALLKGDFSTITKVRIDITPLVTMQIFNREVLPGMEIPLFALGFPNGIKDAVALSQTSCEPIYDYVRCKGLMYHGQSGGPLIDPTNGMVLGVNHAIGPAHDAYFKVLLGIFEAFGVEVK